MSNHIILLLHSELLSLLHVLKRKYKWTLIKSNDLLESKPLLKLTFTSISVIDQMLLQPNFGCHLKDLLAPFFEALIIKEISASLTKLSLISLERLINAGVFSPSCKDDINSCFLALIRSVVRCKFESSDSVTDESVLLRILSVLNLIMDNRISDNLSDSAVCELLETMFSICLQSKLSEPLRSLAESHLHSVIRKVYIRICSTKKSRLDPAFMKNNVQVSVNEPTSIGTYKIAHVFCSESGSIDSITEEGDESIKENISSEFPLEESPIISPNSAVKMNLPEDPKNIIPSMDEYETRFIFNENTSYGIAAGYELLKFVSDLIQPYDRQISDRIRLFGLRLLMTITDEFNRYSLTLPSDDIFSLLENVTCKFLFQLLHVENISLLNISIKLLLRIFEVFQHAILAYVEMFICIVIEILANKDFRNIHSERSDLYFESLYELVHIPGILESLFVFIDSDPSRNANPCEDLLKFFVEILRPIEGQSNYKFDNPRMFALEAVLYIVRYFSQRDQLAMGLKNDNVSSYTYFPPDVLRKQRERKSMLCQAADRFNISSQEGISFLQKSNVFSDEISPEEICIFLRGSPGLSKKSIGEYLSKPVHVDVLKCFISSFDFRDLSIDEALRRLLESFRLPGESAQIERIMETFAEHYYISNKFNQKGTPTEIKSASAAFVLAYSITMLNTDQHNPSVKYRMTCDDFIKNNRGNNDGEDFSKAFLSQIYLNIKENEILMPDEHEGELKFNYRWNELMKSSFAKQSQFGPFLANNFQYDSDIVKLFADQLSTSVLEILEQPVHHTHQLKIFAMSVSILETLCFWGTIEHDNTVLVPKVYERILQLLLIDKESSSSGNFIIEVFRSELLPISLIEDRMIPIQSYIKTQTSVPLSSLETRRIFIIIRFLLLMHSKFSSLISYKLFFFFLGLLFECRRLPISFMNIEDFCLGKHLVFLSKKETDKKSPTIQNPSIFASWGFSTLTSYLTLSSGGASLSASGVQDTFIVDGVTSTQSTSLDLAIIKKKLPDLFPGSSLSFVEESFSSNSDFDSFFKFTAELPDSLFISCFKELFYSIDLFSLSEKHYNLDSNSFSKTDHRLYTSMKELLAFYCEILYLVLHMNLHRISLFWNEFIILVRTILFAKPDLVKTTSFSSSLCTQSTSHEISEVSLIVSPFRAFCCERITTVLVRILFDLTKANISDDFVVFKTQLFKTATSLDTRVFESISSQLLSGFLKLYNCESFFNKNCEQFTYLGMILEKGLLFNTSISFQLITNIITDDYFHVLRKSDTEFDEAYILTFTNVLFIFLDTCNRKQGIPTEYIYQSYNLLFKLFNLLCLKKNYKTSLFVDKFFSFLKQLITIALSPETPHSSRQNALSTFQKCILINGLLDASIEDTCLLYTDILFPLLGDISQTVSLEEEIPFRVFSIISKLVLQCVPLLRIVSSKFHEVWQRYLDLLCQQYKLIEVAEKSSTLIIREAILEILKNILLILKATFDEQATNGMSTDSKLAEWRDCVWKDTWCIIERILPNIKADLGMKHVDSLSSQEPELELNMEQLNIEPQPDNDNLTAIACVDDETSESEPIEGTATNFELFNENHIDSEHMNDLKTSLMLTKNAELVDDSGDTIKVAGGNSENDGKTRENIGSIDEPDKYKFKVEEPNENIFKIKELGKGISRIDESVEGI